MGRAFLADMGRQDWPPAWHALSLDRVRNAKVRALHSLCGGGAAALLVSMRRCGVNRERSCCSRARLGAGLGAGSGAGWLCIHVKVSSTAWMDA
jgi:hypothetical protein